MNFIYRVFLTICMLGIYFVSNAQNSFNTPVLTSITGASNSYSNDEGGTTTFSGADNKILYSVNFSGDVFRKAPVTAPLYKVQRNGISAQNTGATFYAEGTRITNGYNLVTSQPTGNTGDDVMASIFNNGYINGGEDNMFNNNTSSATFNNIERLDYIFPNGVTVVDNTKQGFIICERNANDNFKIAIASGKDGSNNITSYYSDILSISPSTPSWSSVYSNMRSYPYKYDPSDVSFQYPIGTTPGMGDQTVYGILYTFADFGISNGQVVYGISVAPGDAPSTASDWLDISNFPTNTDEGTNGGMDFNGITGMYNESVTITGTVYRDANGMTDGLLNGSGINSIDGTNLYVYLIDPNNKVYDKTQPAANGTYSFSVAGNVSLKVMISTENLQITDDAPSSCFGSNLEWVNTAENYGIGNDFSTGFDLVINGLIDVETSFSSNITVLNFGIEKKPDVDDVSSSALNPGGTTTVQAPTLSGTDLEDGSLGSGDNFIIETLPQISEGILYYNGSAVIAGQTISNYNPSLLTIDPVDGDVVVEFTYSYTDAAGQESDPATATLTVTALTVSGYVYDDADGGSITTTSPISTVSGSQLYAYLVNGSNMIVGKSTVSSGAFSFSQVTPSTTFTVRLSTTSETIGATVPSQNLPTDWTNVGESINGSLDGSNNGNLSINVTTTSNSTLQFALDQRPTTNNVSASALNPGGTSQVAAPVLAGADNEDGAIGSGGKFRIKSLPTNGTLYYNGSLAVDEQLITGFNPSLLAIDPTFTGAGTVKFNYVSVDAANVEDITEDTATLYVYSYTISGTIYQDANGGTIGGTVIDDFDGAQLYAYLVDGSGNVVERQTVAADGTYTLTQASLSVNYTVRISSLSPVSVGQPAPSTAMPTGWVITDEVFGTGNSNGSGSDATDNFQVSVRRTSNGAISGVNFAAEKTPESVDVTLSGACPNSTNTIECANVVGSDPEDGAITNRFRITTLPSNATLYYRNGGSWSLANTSTIYTTNRFAVDPNGTARIDVVVTFNYVSIDAAGVEDPTPATNTTTLWNSSYQIRGSVYDDFDGALANNTLTNSLDGNQLYAYLVNSSNNVVEVMAVGSAGLGTGNYRLYSADLSTDYKVWISTQNVAVGAAAPSASLPSGWVITRDSIGNNNQATTDGTHDLRTNARRNTATNITSLNFGVEKRPESDDKTYSGLNPGGTATVASPALTGTDYEDGTYSNTSGRSIKITEITNGTLYYNSTTLSVGSTVAYANVSYLKIDPTFEGAGTASFKYTWLDRASMEDLTPATVTFTFTGLTISGTVYDDANGATGGISGSGIGTLDGSQLYAYLNISGGVVRDKATVASNGTFSFSNVGGPQTYTITISTSNVNVGDATPVSASLPANWVSVGDDPNTGTLDGSANCIVDKATVASNITGIKIGVNKRPESYSASGSYSNPGGTSSVQVPTLTGLDYEDGAMGSGEKFRIVTVPSTGYLYYNGTLISSATTISNYNPALLTYDPADGYQSISFTFAAWDLGDYDDQTPATITMTFSGRVISGTVFDDANGSTPDGSGIGTVSATQLYAYLVNGSNVVVEKYTIGSGGTYSFVKGANSTNYTVAISTTSVAEGATAPAAANLPSGWVSVGENYGTNNSAGSGNEAGTANSRIAVNVGTFDVSGVNFGLDQLPSSNDASQTFLNPGGVLTVTVPALTGTDPEDGALAAGSGKTIKISTLPSNGTLKYNGSNCTAGQVISNYNSSLLTVDPTPTTACVVTFTYVWRDAASQEDLSPATVTLTFTAPEILTTTPGSRCGSGTVSLSATASAGTINWYDALTGGSLVGTGTTISSPSISSTTTFYCEANANGVLSTPRTAVIATVNTTPTITGTTPGSRCGTGTVSLAATASAGTLNWYTASSGGSLIGTGSPVTTPSISATTTYYVDATSGSCTSARTSVIATVNTSPTITGTTPGSRCGTGTVSLAATASAGTLDWYTASSGGSLIGTGSPVTTPSISATTTYYVDATVGSCTSARTSVLATVNTTPTIMGTTPGSRCGTGTVSLAATASAGTLNWYTASTGGSLIGTGSPVTTPSISATTTYYVDATSGSCTSARTSVIATVNTTPTITGTTPGSRCGTGTVSLAATASAGTLNWYTASSGGSLIGTGSPVTTPSISATTTYYVDATSGSCTSARTSVIATVNTTPTITGTTPGSRCGTGTVSLAATASAGTMNWYTASSGGSLIGTGSPVTTPSISATTTYYVDATLGSCTSARTSVIATINTTPTITGTTPGSRCGTGTVSLAATASAGTLNWYTASTGGSLIGTGSPVTTPSISATTTYYVDATSGSCTSARTSVIATVNTTPTITGTTPGSRCGTGTVSLAATASAGTLNWYTASSGGSLIGTGSPVTTPSISATTTYYVDATSGGCTSARTSVIATVNTTPTITGTTPGSRCGTGTVSLAATASAGTLNWYDASTGGSTIGTGSPVTTPSISASTTYYVDATLGSCTSARTAVLASVGVTQEITFTTPGSRCGTGTVTLGANATGGTINWYSALTGGSSLGTGNSYTTPSISSTTTYYVDVTDGSCTSTPRESVVAYILPPASITAGGGGAVCEGSTISLTSSGTNITNQYWTGPNGFYSTSANPTIPSATAAMAGTYEVNGNSLSGINLVANGDFESGNVGFTSSYNYVVDGVATNELNPEGNYSVVPHPSTTHTNFCYCGDHSSGSGNMMAINGAGTASVVIWSQTVNVAQNTDFQFTYWLQTIVNGNDPAPSELQLYINGSAAGPIYTANSTTGIWTQFTYNWNSGSASSAVLSLVNQNTTLTGNDFALDDIFFQQTCEDIDQVTVTVNAAPTITGSTPGSRCGTGTVSLGATASAGTVNWYSAATGGSSLGSGTTFTTPSISATTTYYAEASNGSCNSIARTAVIATVNTTPTVLTTTPGYSCGTGTANLSASASAGSLEWFSALTGGVAIGTGTTFTTPSISATTSFFVEANDGLCTSSSRTEVIATVHEVPTITSTTPGTFCGTSGTVTLEANSSLGTINWYSAVSGGASLGNGNFFTTPTISSTTTYYVDATSDYCVSNPRTAVTATVNPASTLAVSMVASPSSICEGASSVLTATNSGGSVTKSFSASSGTLNMSITDNSRAAYTYPTITLSGAGSATLASTDLIQVNLNITHPYVGDLDIFLVDPSGTRAMLVSSDNGGSGDNFTNTIIRTDAATNITSGSAPYTGTYRFEGTISTVPVRTGAANSGNYNLVVPGTALTGSPIDGAWSLRVFDDASDDVGTLIDWSLSINTTVGYTSVITGPANLSSVTYSGANNTTAQATATPSAGSNVYTVTTTDGNGCSAINTATVTVTAFPTISSTTPGSRCGTGTVSLAATASAGTLNWYTASSGGSLIGTGSPVTTPSISATTTYYVEATSGSCTSARTAVLATINVSPTITSSTPGSRCGTGTVSLAATASAGTLNWYDASTGGSLIGTGSPFTTPSISATTTYYVDATLGSCTSARTSVIATVNTIPTITGSTPGSRCGTGTVSLAATASAGTLNWYDASTGGSLVGTGSPVTTPSISATTTYYVDATSGSCTSARTSVIATVNTTPTITGTTPGSRCGTGTISLAATASAGTLNWYDASTGGSLIGTGSPITTPSISATTTYYVDATSGSCTSARTSVIATVNSSPTITGTTPGSRCGTGTVSLAATASSGTLNWYDASSGGSLIGTGSPVTTPSISATTTYYVDATSGSCTSARTAVIATINDQPVINFTTAGSRCGTGTVTLGANASTGTINWYAALTGGSSLGTGSSYTTPSISSNTTYYVDATNGTCVSTPRQPVVAYILPVVSITAGGGGTVCQGSTISLTSSGTNVSNQYWTGPNSFYSTSANPTISNATTAMSGTYTVTGNSLSGVNLVTNGDFELGNVGFTSSYTYVVDGSATNELYPASTYAVVPHPSTTHPNFCSCADHSSGSGNMMAINGANTAGVNIWSQTVNVAQNTDFQFTYWLQTIVNGNDPAPSRLQLYINGVAAGPVYTANATTGVWTQFTYNWNSGSSGSAVLSLINQNTASTGNDFALDDIFFQQTCEDVDQVTVTVNAAPTVTSTTPGSVCGTGSATLGATASAGTVNWYTAPTGGTAQGSGNTFITPSISSTTTYYAGAINGSCNSLTRTAVVATVNPRPSAPSVTSQITNVCPATTADLTSALQSAATGVFVYKNSVGSVVATPTSVGSGDYTVVDSLITTGCKSNPSDIEVVLSPCYYTISGTIYNDVDGTNDGLIDGSTVYNPSGSQLYMNLVSTSTSLVLGSVAVASNGTYTLDHTDGVLSNTSFNLVLSTSNGVVGNPITALLPTNWVNTAEGNTTTGDGSTNGITLVNVVTSDLTNINFGIDGLPTPTNNTAASQGNPGSTNQATVPATTFSGTDALDASGGIISSIQLTAFPTNATSIVVNGISYTSSSFPGGGINIPTNSSGNPTQTITVDPTDGVVNVVFSYKVLDNASKISTTTATATVPFTTLSIAGIVYNDGNGANDLAVNGTPTGTLEGSQLYAYLNIGAGVVLDKVTIPSNGVFQFNGLLASTAYKVTISTSNVNTGAATPSSTNLPANWVEVGDYYGTNNASGSSFDVTTNGIINSTTGTSSISNIRFGFNKRPTSDDKTRFITNPGLSVSVPFTGLTGTDNEDGAMNNGETYVIKTLPGNANLYYNGSQVTLGQVISNFDSTLFEVDPTFSGYGIISFTYASRDLATTEDLTPATVTVTVSAIWVAGQIFQDGNGLTDNLINGTGIGSIYGSQLYAYLVQDGQTTVYEKALVQSDGIYRFLKADFNATYTVIVSLVSVAEGAQAPASASLPANWHPTGDSYGTNNAAGSGIFGGIPNAQITVTSTILNITSIFFGAEPKPIAHPKAYLEQDPATFNTPSGNPVYPDLIQLSSIGGTNDTNISTSTLLPGRLSGWDEDDGRYAGATGLLSNLKLILKTLPDNSLLVYVGAKADVELVPNPTASDPSYAYWNPATSEYEIENFNANDLVVYFDNENPDDIVFEYAWEDEAEAESDPAEYRIEFKNEGTPLPVELLSFSGKMIDDKESKLEWVTATENNSYKFVVEKSTDMINFDYVGELSAAGNSNAILNYALVDHFCTAKINYYRLKTIDNDGSFEFSNVILLSNSTTQNSVIVSPNPASSFVNINVSSEQSEDVLVEITDMTGKVLRSAKIVPSESSTIDISSFSRGVYMLKVHFETGTEVVKLIKN